MSDEFSFKVGEYRCVAVRSDRPWGNGLRVDMFGADGQLSNIVMFACHPEFPGFDTLQAMGTEQLVERAAAQLRTGGLEASLSEARISKLGTIHVRFGPEA
jgi:hypothetical protein